MIRSKVHRLIEGNTLKCCVAPSAGNEIVTVKNGGKLRRIWRDFFTPEGCRIGALKRAVALRDSVPKGQKASAQDFQNPNPGNYSIKRFALKGRDIRTRLTCVVARFDLAPFQGASPGEVRFPRVETLS
jgi:hypothetical protein